MYGDAGCMRGAWAVCVGMAHSLCSCRCEGRCVRVVRMGVYRRCSWGGCMGRCMRMHMGCALPGAGRTRCARGAAWASWQVARTRRRGCPARARSASRCLRFLFDGCVCNFYSSLWLGIPPVAYTQTLECTRLDAAPWRLPSLRGSAPTGKISGQS